MKKKKRKGNVLVVTLIVLGVVLMAALSMSLTSVKERKGSISETKTNSAIQNAQTGLEVILQEISDNPSNKKTKQLDNCQSHGEHEGKIYDDPEGRFYVELYEDDSPNDPKYFKCNDSGKEISDIYRVKSVGISQGETRAIGAGVKKNDP